MRYLIVVGVFLAGTVAFAGPSRKQTSISKTVAESILSTSETLGQRIQKQIKAITGDSDSALVSIQDVIEPASNWRYYYRDRGILIAIPVKQRLPYLDRFHGEIEVATLAERLVLQSDNQRIEGAIRVVFIEPQPECPHRRTIHPQISITPAAAETACGCR